MKVDVEQVDTCVRRLNIEVPADRVDREFSKHYNDLQRRVKMPGFRPGKIPRRILENHYRPSVQQEVMQHLVPEVLSEAITETGLRTVGQPSIDQVELNPSEPLKLVVTAQVLPEITVGDYKGWSFERRLMRIEASHIDTSLDQLRDKHAELHTVSDRVIATGDYAIINYTGMMDGEPIEGGTAANVSLEVGSGTLLPEIEQALVGLERDAETTIPISFGDDYHDSNVAGKTLEFNVKVVEIKEKILPELDDEFATAYEEEDTLEALRERLREELEESVRQTANTALQGNILDRLVAENPVDVPEILLQEQMRQLYYRQLRETLGRNLVEEEFQVDPESLQETFGEQALEVVRGQVILHHIEAALGMTLDEAEVEAEIASIAARMAQNPDALKHSMEHNGSLNAFRTRLQERKLFEALIDMMDIQDKVVSEAELTAAQDAAATTASDAPSEATSLSEEG